MTALGLSLHDVRAGALQIDPPLPSSQLVENATGLEETLTEVIHRILVEHGVEPMRGKDGEDNDDESHSAKKVGLCPNCEEKIPLESAACPNCNVPFGQGSEWQIKPLSNS